MWKSKHIKKLFKSKIILAFALFLFITTSADSIIRLTLEPLTYFTEIWSDIFVSIVLILAVIEALLGIILLIRFYPSKAKKANKQYKARTNMVILLFFLIALFLVVNRLLYWVIWKWWSTILKNQKYPSGPDGKFFHFREIRRYIFYSSYNKFFKCD